MRGILGGRLAASGASVSLPDPLAGLALGQAPVDPSTVGQLPATYLAAGSFVLVLAFGTLVLWRSQRFIEHGIDTSMAQPHMSVVYGLIAYGLVGFLGFLILMQLSFVGVTSPSFRYVAIGLVAVAMLSLAGPGYAIVGTRLVDLQGSRQPWNGLALGAVLSAASWLVLPLQLAALVWLLVAALGIGGPVREWMHDERGVSSDAGS
jgi:hypothetical protein